MAPPGRTKLRKGGWLKLALIAILLGFVMLNTIAWMQAWAMTHYASTGQATAKPEELSLPEKAWAIVTGVTVPRPHNTRTPEDVGLRYETEQIKLNEGEWLEAWYVPHSESKGVVLMFPGYAGSKDVLLSPAVAFHDMGYDLLLVDFRGAGGSSGDTTTLGVREADDVAQAVAYAREKWRGERVVLYGVSMGSAAIMRAVARDGVQADALVLESPFNSLLDTVANRFRSMGLPPFPSAELMLFWGGLQQGFNGFEHNPQDYAPSIHIPALILLGEHDPRVTVEQGTAIYERLGGPKEMVVIPGAEHELLYDAAPELWKEHVEKLLDKAACSNIEQVLSAR